MASISLAGLTKRFGDLTAVASLDLEIGDKEFVALLGPSGCGKTTTMNMIAGIETPTEGQILFDGRDMRLVPPNRRKVGFVFQNYAIFTHLSVRENLAFGLKVRNLPRAEVERRVGAMAGADAPRGPARLAHRQAQRQRAAEGRDRPLGHHRARDLPAGRAAEQSRRRLPRLHADRAQAPAAPVPADHGLRYPRPDRGDEPGRPDRRDGPRRAAAVRLAHRGLQRAAQRLRRQLHGQPQHEPGAVHAQPAGTALMRSISARAAARPSITTTSSGAAGRRGSPR